MQENKSYQHGDVVVRDVCLLPASKGWQLPNEAEVKAVMDAAGMTPAAVESYFGVDGRTVRRWRSGEANMPFAVWARIVFLAGYGDIYG